MQDGSWNQPLPMSLLLKEPAGGRTGTLEGDGGVFSEASSDSELYVDSVTELDCGDGDFADLTAFLSVEEINLSLDLAREAFDDQCECEDPGPSKATAQGQVLHHSRPQTTEHLQQHQTINTPSGDGPAGAEPALVSKPKQTSSESTLSSSTPSAAGRAGNHKSNQPVYKQDKPRLLHEGLELNERSASATEFCSRAATFIEELSSIFKSTPHLEQQEEDSSSPDSGYLSPRSRRPAPQGSVSAAPAPPSQPEEVQRNQPTQEQQGAAVGAAAATRYQPPGAPTSAGPLSPPCFLQKLKSQEVAEGSPIRLECRVRGNPQPLVR